MYWLKALFSTHYHLILHTVLMAAKTIKRYDGDDYALGKMASEIYSKLPWYVTHGKSELQVKAIIHQFLAAYRESQRILKQGR